MRGYVIGVFVVVGAEKSTCDHICRVRQGNSVVPPPVGCDALGVPELLTTARASMHVTGVALFALPGERRTLSEERNQSEAPAHNTKHKI